ncbi:hypothetical protein F9U42_20240 [Pectobacterium versatile]|uniref:hypothetical protein n=1 Tax=Pectobacterium versatile TaxID=2488639 RepID=UPI0015DD5E51|nr:MULTISPECIES: hypothetical protein [Pectobacterium]MBA0165268.1 hypothetical protein [Pectobacterium versatile]MBD0848621.1 membrane protein [Pectobacterium carotovorum subsp. carotovorum]MBK4827753.1 hypothetical protein [Pectobacterium carotovorum subsp. carotovorum]MBQ4769473.1 hypothetical protein [Pectobacterium versatile]MCO4315213.1 hypothetical protein [Pectobacterium versatile]
MNAMNSAILHVVATATLVMSGFAQADDMAKAHTGKDQVELKHIHAVLQNGTPSPQHDAMCEKQLNMPESKYVGMKVTTEYNINTQSMMMSAKSMFPSPHSTQPMELTADLSPLGLADSYSFGAFKPSSLPNAYIIFSVDKKMKNPVSTFMVINESETYNCVISSSKDGLSKEAMKSLEVKK